MTVERDIAELRHEIMQIKQMIQALGFGQQGLASRVELAATTLREIATSLERIEKGVAAGKRP
jgi:hypothetical protein